MMNKILQKILIILHFQSLFSRIIFFIYLFLASSFFKKYFLDYSLLLVLKVLLFFHAVIFIFIFIIIIILIHNQCVDSQEEVMNLIYHPLA